MVHLILFLDPGHSNDQYELNEIDSGESRSTQLPICDHCTTIKPLRAHHCRICNVCVLRMDHHCPWFYNCIGLKNYRFFVIFLINAGLWMICIGFIYFICYFYMTYPRKQTFHLLLNATMLLLLGLCILCFGIFHILITCNNLTTIEFNCYYFTSGPLSRSWMFSKGVRKTPFSLSSKELNFESVFGAERRALKVWKWLIFDYWENDVVKYIDVPKSSPIHEIIDSSKEEDSFGPNNFVSGFEYQFNSALRDVLIRESESIQFPKSGLTREKNVLNCDGLQARMKSNGPNVIGTQL